MKIYISDKANEEIVSFLGEKGHDIVRVKKHADVSEAIDCHPDIYYCLFEDGIYEGDASLLGKGYPGEVRYNAASVGRYFIYSRYTGKELLEYAQSLGLIPVEVPQGYVKCNLAVLDGTHVITEDRGIAKVLSGLGDMGCLLIEPGEVRLPGYRNGFIGGACGRVGNMMVFNGDLSSCSFFSEVEDLCHACSLEPVYFDSYPLTDIGSILASEL